MTDAYSQYRARRQEDVAQKTSAAPGENQTAQQKSAEKNTDTQLGIQSSANRADEFQPYGPEGLRKNERTADPVIPEQKAKPPTGPVEVNKEDPQTQQVIAQLKSTEEKVKAHEAAHKAAGGAATGPISYSYTRGPDGKNYITGGEVPITISSGRTPQETISRMQQVIQAALAPADPSPQDRSVAAQAATIQQAARQEQASNPSGNTADATSTDTANKGVKIEDSAVAPAATANGSKEQSLKAYSDPAVTGKESPAKNFTSQQSQQINNEPSTSFTANESANLKLSDRIFSGTGESSTSRSISYFS
jgi:hypothetical protein